MPCPERASPFGEGFSPRIIGLKPAYVYICHMKAPNTPLLIDLLQNRMYSDEGEMYAIECVYMRIVRMLCTMLTSDPSEETIIITLKINFQ